MRPDDSLRNAVWERDEGLCGLCGEAADPGEWQLDHIVPQSLGGPDTADNLRVAHPGCNRRRAHPRRMTTAQIEDTAAEWTVNELTLDKYATVDEYIAAHEALRVTRVPRPEVSVRARRTR